jgi:hypothetical protein
MSGSNFTTCPIIYCEAATVKKKVSKTNYKINLMMFLAFDLKGQVKQNLNISKI